MTHPNNDLHCLQFQVLLVTVQHVLQLPMSTEKKDITASGTSEGAVCAASYRVQRTSANEQMIL